MGDTRKNANGEGSVFSYTDSKGRTRWKVQITLGVTADGRVKRTTRRAATRADAEKLKRTLLKQRDDGQLTQIQQHTVSSLGTFWAREIAPLTVRQTTASGYEYNLRQYVNPTVGNIRISNLRATDVQRMIATLRADGKSANTVNAARRTLHGLCTFAVRQGYINVNPVAATAAVKRQQGERTQVQRPWTIEESCMVLRKAELDERIDCFVHIMLYTGLRPGEALGLRWADIDFDGDRLHVTGTLREERRITPNGSGVVRTVRNDPKTLHSRRSLPLHPDLKRALERQQMRQSVRRMTDSTVWKDSGYVITTEVGTPVYASNNRKHFYGFLKSSGVRRIRPHDMRHVVAKNALEADIRIEDVSQALGHTRIDTTKQVYAGRVQRLNDRFGAGVGDLYSTGIRELEMNDINDEQRH